MGAHVLAVIISLFIYFFDLTDLHAINFFVCEKINKNIT